MDRRQVLAFLQQGTDSDEMSAGSGEILGIMKKMKRLLSRASRASPHPRRRRLKLPPRPSRPRRHLQVNSLSLSCRPRMHWKMPLRRSKMQPNTPSSSQSSVPRRKRSMQTPRSCGLKKFLQLAQLLAYSTMMMLSTSLRRQRALRRHQSFCRAPTAKPPRPRLPRRCWPALQTSTAL